MTTFDTFLRTILKEAGAEASAEGSATIEAQHLLLAMSSHPETDAGQLLQSVGLDRDALRAALERELESALGAAGLSLAAARAKPAESAPNPDAQLGTSVRHALERGLDGIRRGPRPADLLLGILRAEVGTVPRALALAGLNRAELVARVEQALDAGGA